MRGSTLMRMIIEGVIQGSHEMGETGSGQGGRDDSALQISVKFALQRDMLLPR